MGTKRRVRARTGPRGKAAAPVVSAPPGLEALNPGLVGIEKPEAGREADAAADGSVQDPLQDWPEAEGEPDGWLLERATPPREQEER